jgi:hypothetical protein
MPPTANAAARPLPSVTIEIVSCPRGTGPFPTLVIDEVTQVIGLAAVSDRHADRVMRHLKVDSNKPPVPAHDSMRGFC